MRSAGLKPSASPSRPPPTHAQTTLDRYSLDENKVKTFFENHALSIPVKTTPTDIALAIRDAHGKELFLSDNSVATNFNVTREDVAKNLQECEVPEDMRAFFRALKNLAQT